MKVNGSFETDEQYGLRILKWLRVYETKDSLYLFDDISPNDAALSQIAFLQSDTILISRMPKENWNFPILEIHALESLAEQKALFERYFERELLPEEIEDFSAIASLVNGHTMTLALTAIQIRESAASLKQIREVFERQGVFTEDKVSFPYGENQEERNMYGHIRALYNFSEWQDEEKIMLSILCLIPSIGIGKEELKSILGEDACNSLNRLRRYGWIEESFHGQDRWITLHNVISEIVYREIYLQYNYNFSFFIRYIENAVWNMRNLSFEKQNRYISYGEHLLKRLTDGTDKLDLILILVQQYEYLRKTKEAIEVLQQYERIMTDLGLENTVYHGHYHNNFALIYQRDNDLKTALSHFTEARKIYKNCGKDTIKYYALLLHNEARVRYGLGWHDQALELEEEAEPLLIEHNISYWGYIYDVRGDNYARMAWNSIEKANQNTGLLAVCLQKEAKLYLKKWRICQNKAYKLKKCYNAPEHEVMISLMGRAQAKAFCGNTKGAKKDIQKVFEFRKKKSGARSEAMADVYDKMCIIYEKSGEFEESVRYGQLAVDIFTERFGADSDEVKRAQYNLEFVLNEKK